jgi:hypothetical protein
MASPYDPLTWYWSVQDTSPGTQVWSGASGSFVALNNGTYTAWLALGNTATVIDTFVNLAAVINDWALSLANAGSGNGIASQLLLGSDVTLTNPMKRVQSVIGGDAGHYIRLPAMNVANSVPIGMPIVFVNASIASADFDVQASDGTVLATVPRGGMVILYNSANTTAPGLISVGLPSHSNHPPQDYLINGNGYFKQTSAASVSSPTDGVYGHDQWVALTQTAAIDVSSLVDTADGLYRMMRLSQPQASAQRMGYLQPIEGARCKHLRGASVGLVLRLRYSNAAAVRYAILEHTGTEDSPTLDVVLDWTSNLWNVGGFFINSNLTVRQVGSITPAANTLTEVPITNVTLGSSFNNLLVFIWTEGTAAQNSTLDFAANLCRASAAIHPVRFRSLDEELLACRRYLFKLDIAGTNVAFAISQAYSASQALAYVVFPVNMRTIPALSFTAESDFALVNAAASSAAAPTSIALGGATTTNARIDFGGSSGLAAGNACLVQGVGGGSGKMYFSARM